VVSAPPGAGKTTVVPLALLDAAWRGDGTVLVLEPRRLATRAAARRMAQLAGSGPGDLVGYQTRDERVIGPATRIEVLTEGVLTRRLQHDPELCDRSGRWLAAPIRRPGPPVRVVFGGTESSMRLVALAEMWR
jgi:HrpA-like RNA helicase